MLVARPVQHTKWSSSVMTLPSSTRPRLEAAPCASRTGQRDTSTSSVWKRWNACSMSSAISKRAEASVAGSPA